MRVVTALEYAAESAECEYVATPLSRAATLPHLEAYIVHRCVKVHVENITHGLLTEPSRKLRECGQSDQQDARLFQRERIQLSHRW